jgi:predicted P-loop ATPase
MWAQAYNLFRSGFTYWLEEEEQKRIAENNSSNSKYNPTNMKLLITYMYPPEEGEAAEAELTNAEILAHLQNKVSIKLID